MALPQTGRTARFTPYRRSTDPKPRDLEPPDVSDDSGAPARSPAGVHELRLRSIAYGTEQTAFHYESVETFPTLKFWLQLHACTNVTQEGPYVTFKQVRAATLIESRIAVGNYLLIVASGPLKGTVQPGDADDVANLYWIVDQPSFSGQVIDDPEQLLLQATDDVNQRLLRRLITAEGLLTRSGHEAWCVETGPPADACSCGYHELVAAWCEVSGSDPEQFGLRWQRTCTYAPQRDVQPGERPAEPVAAVASGEPGAKTLL